jgi:tripartite-type tricarboxylate transporter receptor subunit TctC
MKHYTQLALAILSIACWPGSAASQAFPSKPIRYLVTYPPGGSTDINARIIAVKMSESLGKQVIIDNRGGASGMIATDILAKSTPDGHTIITVDTAHAANPAMYRKVPYDTLKDFTAISLVTRIPMMLLVNPSVPANSVKELVALAKSKPGQLNYGSAGAGSPMFLVAELFKSTTDINVVHVPYKGGGPALADLVGGQVPMVFITLTAGMPLVKAGRARALGVTSLQRSASHPEIASVAESGVPGFEFYLWQATLAPAGVPRAIITRLNKEIVGALADPDIKERLTASGNELIGSTPERADEFIRSELALWRKTIKPEMRLD